MAIEIYTSVSSNDEIYMLGSPWWFGTSQRDKKNTLL
jgi:hypothetical protein